MASDAMNAILSVPEFRQRFERLLKRVEADPQKVVPWIGAGMSKSFGLPLWQEFLERASGQLVPGEREIFGQLIALSNSDLSLVAEYLHSRLGSRLHQEVIDTFNKTMRWEPGNCLVPWLGIDKVITTNYDRILDSGLPWLAPVTALTAASDYREQRCLIKLHGRVDDPKTIVLTISQYVRAYTSEFWAWLEQFARDRTFVFLGCSLHSDEFLKVLRTPESGSQQQHFAVIPTNSPQESLQRGTHLLQRYGIQTISYDPIQHGHGVVRELMASLRPGLAAEKKQIERIRNETEAELAWFIFQNDAERAERGERIEYLAALLPVVRSLCQNSTVPAAVFDELLKYCDHHEAFAALLEAADGPTDVTRVLGQREKLRPAYEIVEVLAPSSDPHILNYYKAFRFGEHDTARQCLLTLEKRPMLDRGRIAVLILQNELFAGYREQKLVEDFERRLSRNPRRAQYLPYGLGLFNLWTGDIKRAKSNFRTAQTAWRKGRGAFVMWQLALCAILEGDLTRARVQLAEMEDAAFPPLGVAENFIKRAGGSELSLELRRTASHELQAWLWFLRDLVTRALGQPTEIDERKDGKRRLLEKKSEGDLLLSWFLYAAQLLEGKNEASLRIEQQFRTRASPGTKLILDAVTLLLTKVSAEAAASFATAVSEV